MKSAGSGAGKERPGGSKNPNVGKPDPDEEDICAICRGPKNNPIFVNCGHSFCSVCLDNLVYSLRFHLFRRCPLCRGYINDSADSDNTVDLSDCTFSD
ncbi:hypothetical protein KR074_008527 [Drosophila pseudoananassae]|nr:hypothetical protein KR074_008527 [Drosophila pseudoananassae]